MACILGAEYYGSWEKAAAQLLKFGEEYAHAWPLHSVMSVWEELWARFTEELRALDRRARREMQDESPSFDRLRFFATSPGDNGEPWLRLPQTFDLQAPGEYFQTDIVPRQQRMLDRACWSMALKRPSPLTGGRAGAEDIGGPDKAQPSAPNPRNPRAGGKGSAPGANTAAKEPAPLLGNALTSKEAGRSMDHRPKDKDGKYLCWDYFSHPWCCLEVAWLLFCGCGWCFLCFQLWLLLWWWLLWLLLLLLLLLSSGSWFVIVKFAAVVVVVVVVVVLVLVLAVFLSCCLVVDCCVGFVAPQGGCHIKQTPSLLLAAGEKS